MEANPGTAQPWSRLRLCRESLVSTGSVSELQSDWITAGTRHAWAGSTTYQQFLESSSDGRREAGFHNVNVDLMFAIPGQTCESWKHNLETVAELLPEHISAYSLIIEEGTPFARKKLILPTEDDRVLRCTRILQRF